MPIRLSNTIYATKKPKEVDIQRAILQYLKLKGIFHFRVNTGGLMRQGKWVPSPNTTKGTADIIAIKPTPALIPVKNVADVSPTVAANYGGKLVAIEVKRPGAKPSADQLAFLEGVKKAGGIGIVAYSVADVQKIFE